MTDSKTEKQTMLNQFVETYVYRRGALLKNIIIQSIPEYCNNTFLLSPLNSEYSLLLCNSHCLHNLHPHISGQRPERLFGFWGASSDLEWTRDGTELPSPANTLFHRCTVAWQWIVENVYICAKFTLDENKCVGNGCYYTTVFKEKN